MLQEAIAPVKHVYWKLHNLKRNLYYRHVANFVFIHINKCGGSSIEVALNIPFEHKTATQYIGEIGERRWNNIFRFSFVRNPWDRVVSHYHYRVMTNQTNMGDNIISFNEWVLQAYREENPAFYDQPQMFMPQSNWISDPDGRIIVDFVGRFENIQADFAHVASKIGNKVRALPHHKASKRGGYQQYYSDESRNIVEERFSKDIENFGYRF